MLAPGSEVLEAIADARHRLYAFGIRFRDQPGVRRIHHDLWLSPSSSDGAIPLDLYLDVEFSHGPGLVWELDVTWYADWVISTKIRFVNGEDDEVIRRFADRRASSVAGFVAELSNAVDDLIAVGLGIDLANYGGRYPPEQ